MKLSSHEKRFTNLVKENQSYIKKNHGSIGSFYDFVFLCGAQRKEGTEDNRTIVAKILSSNKNIRYLYSEDLFSYLIELDLLTFEELLMEISTNVIIIVETWGAATELGAFSFVDDNIDKLIVINKERYEFESSFITNGPIRKIRERTSKKLQSVFYERFTKHGDLEFLTSSEKLINRLENLEPSNTLKSNPFEVESRDRKILIITDVRYVIWLLFDILKLFATFKEGNSYNILLAIFDVEIIHVRTNSKNCITNQVQVKKIIEFLMTILLKFNFIILKDGNYKINYSFFNSNAVKVNHVSNLLFNESFYNSRKFLKSRTKLLNKLKKSGVFIWET